MKIWVNSSSVYYESCPCLDDKSYHQVDFPTAGNTPREKHAFLLKWKKRDNDSEGGLHVCSQEN